MKVAAFEVKDYELKDFERAKAYGLDISLYADNLSDENI